MRQTIAILILLFLIFNAKAQVLTQTVRGSIVDKASETPLPGANIVVENSNPFIGTSTDANGNFKITKVPVGRQTIKITYIGYKDRIVSNIDVTSGKELVINISLEENIFEGKEVEITGSREKQNALNDMATVSARTFSVEEAQKYAAAVNDPARMASAYAGVVSADDGNNNIIIRGNNPNGLLWRMEGVDIPNPNHFSSPNSSGGGISILSAQLLSNSDFMTGAFAAEYGNALSGVFDLKLRKGNNEKKEYTLQAGFLGVDFATEGPFSKAGGGSYLINYRYSTLSLLSNIGVNIGDSPTNFQDLSFNLSLPTNKAGNFSLFGFGGLSSQKFTAEKDSTKWEYEYQGYNDKFIANTGAIGLTHFIAIGDNTYIKSSITSSASNLNFISEKLVENYTTQLEYNEYYKQYNQGVSSTLNKKFNSQNTVRLGINLKNISFDLNQLQLNDQDVLTTLINSSGNTNSIQLYGQWQYRLSEKLTFNSGIHYFNLLLNNSQSVEPRAGVKYQLNNKNSFSFGYGLHSQMQPIGIYFVKPIGSSSTPNQNLDFTKSHQLVMGYDKMLTKDMHLKLETYYQALYNMPVSADKSDYYSLVNVSNQYPANSLANKGTGKNYGLELTLEKYLGNDYYFMLSTSLYESKYKGSNGIEKNTRFNGNFATTFLAGKEFQLSQKMGNRIFGINIKLIYTGGLRETPINLSASKEQNETILFEDRAFENRVKNYFRTDARISLKRNRERYTCTWSLDLQNATNAKNIYGQYFDTDTGAVATSYQTPLIPILSYRVEF
jgi:CarboxypepD_reg-like domain/TonB dependent receptor/TonB-dependent Receptor Plug Domain